MGMGMGDLFEQKCAFFVQCCEIECVMSKWKCQSIIYVR